MPFVFYPPTGIQNSDIPFLVGLLLGFILVQPSSVQDMHMHLSLLVDNLDMSLPELDFSVVETEWNKIRNSIPDVWKLSSDGREFQVGQAAKDRGLTADFPVVLIPGIISTVRASFLLQQR
jgi:phospholipid:diacylglycerol acyltransferase